MIEHLLAIQQNTPVMVVLCIVLLLFLLFIGYYVIRSWLLLKALRRSCVVIDGIGKTPDADLSPAFLHDEGLAHLWSEYRHTLHEQTEPDAASGTERIIARRSTVPAEVFFSPSTVVDGRIGVEFFRHLPGVFTGLGIIGTFLGLIAGLQRFQLRAEGTNSIDPSAAVLSLEALINGVAEAFFVSATAIVLAMVVTLVEKALLQRLYSRVEVLVRRIDERFDFGANEEYLLRLTRAAEDSASQSKILKDALVGELKDILTSLTERQVSALEAGHRALQTGFADQIQQGLKTPLDRIAEGFTEQRNQQGQQLSGMLADLLATFTDRLQHLFGDQVQGINEMQRRTVEALSSSVEQFRQLAASIEASGSRAGEAMAAQLSNAIDAMETRQAAMNAAMSDFLEQMRQALGQSQAEAADTNTRWMAELATSVQALVQSMNEASQRSSLEMQTRQDALAAQARAEVEAMNAAVARQIQGATDVLQKMIAGVEASGARALSEAEVRQRALSEQARSGVEALAGAIGEHRAEAATAVQAMREAVEALRSVSTQAIEGMNRGAGTMQQAAARFVDAGSAVSGTLERASALGKKLDDAGTNVSSASAALQTVLADYRGARDSLLALLPQLTQIVDAAKREAGLTKEVLASIEKSTHALKGASDEAAEYLDDVAGVIGESFEAFQAGMVKAVGGANKAYQEELSSAVGRIKEVVDELDSALSSVVDTVSRKR